MTLLELRARYRSLFYDQTPWFADEVFMRVLPNEKRWEPPTHIVNAGKAPRSSKGLPLAVDLAHAYVIDPDAAIWQGRYFWCRDLDSHGQRVFVGCNGKGLEIHRHIHITPAFGVPRWD